MHEYEFREGAFPQQKIRKPLVAAGADQQIDLRRASVVDFREDIAERFRRKLRDLVEAARRMINRLARGVIHRQPEMQPRALGRGRFRIADGLPQRGGQAVPPPDDAEPHAFLDAMRRFGEQIFVEQPQDRLHFDGRAFPIRGGKREKRQRVNSQARRRLNDATRRFRSRAVAGRARQTPRGRPPAIAIRNDGHMELWSLGDGRPRSIWF